MWRTDFTGIIKSLIYANSHRVSLLPMSEAKYLAQGRPKPFVVRLATAYQTPRLKVATFWLKSRPGQRDIRYGESLFNGSDFPAHTFTLLEEWRRNDTLVKEINESVMESVEEPCNRLIFRRLTKPLGSKRQKDKHRFARRKVGWRCSCASYMSSVSL